MSSILAFAPSYAAMCVGTYASGPGMLPFSGMWNGVQRLPTDSIGNYVLTLSGVVVGSRVHIEVFSTGQQLHDSVAADSTVTVSVPVYASGSPLNSLRIKVRKASGSPNYRPYETLATAVIGSAGIYISQALDE